MPVSSSTQTLSIIAQHYQHDTDYHHRHRETDRRRRESLPGIQRIIADFVQRHTTFQVFVQHLRAHLHTTDGWRATRFWMMTLNQLAHTHGQPAETTMRQLLEGLNAANVGERIEQMHTFLMHEREQPGTGHTRNQLAAPGNSAFLVSLFAAWLDPEGGSFIAWPNPREGLCLLLKAGVLPDTQTLTIAGNKVRITTAQEYTAVQQVIQWMAPVVQPVSSSPHWWAERFLDWVKLHEDELPEWLATEGATLPGRRVLFPDEPLRPCPPDLLRQHIRAIRRRLLVSDEVIRRCYRALVLGQHIILSGPPGTGKTELACMLPRTLWHQEGHISAYTTQLVTATSEWTPRHVIGGIAPAPHDDKMSYTITYGCLSASILSNWELDPHHPEQWHAARRCSSSDPANPTDTTAYRGCWLVIDEFNRAPIDLAFGEALTALGGTGGVLQVPTLHGSAALPIPLDFRIIGTLNTFDRHFLNQMSEALKRRFAFITVLPPTRQQRNAEQAMVLARVLQQLQLVCQAMATTDPTGTTAPAIVAGGADGTAHDWRGLVAVREGQDSPSDSPSDDPVPWLHEWATTPAGTPTAAQQCFEEGWRLFEVLRLYRQFGTAQAIAWATHYFGAGLLDRLAYDDEAGWRRCLDMAFADTLADQMQVLFPDELDALLLFLRSSDGAAFCRGFAALLERLTNPRRRMAHLRALQSVRDTNGAPLLTDETVQSIATHQQASIPDKVLTLLFAADAPRGRLPLLEARIEELLFERTL